MSFVTVQELLDRLDARYALDLTESEPGGGVDEGRVALALSDATAELEGWLARLPASRRPPPNTLKVHCIKVATYMLTLDRPGKEFEQIRNAYNDTVEFYKSLDTAVQASGGATPIEVTSSAPAETFSDAKLKGLAP